MSPEIRQVRENRDNSRDTDRGRGKGSYLDYYEDLGFSTTKGAYDKWKSNEDQWQSERGEELGRISEYEGQLAKYKEEIDAAKKEMPTVAEATNKAWDTHKSNDLRAVSTVGSWKKESTGEYLDGGIIPSVWEKSNPGYDLDYISGESSGESHMYEVFKLVPEIDETYYLPDSLIQAKIYGDEGALETLKPKELESYSDYGVLLNTSYKSRMFTGSGNFSKELEATLNAAQDKYYADYIEAVGAANREEIAKAMEIIASKSNEYEAALASATTARDRIAAIDSIREREMNDLRADYDSKIETMKEIFGG